MIEWTREKPTKEGFYLFKAYNSIGFSIKHIQQGNWRSAQNPEVLYADTDPVGDLDGQWFGVIPEPLPKKLFR